MVSVGASDVSSGFAFFWGLAGLQMTGVSLAPETLQAPGTGRLGGVTPGAPRGAGRVMVTKPETRLSRVLTGCQGTQRDSDGRGPRP